MATAIGTYATLANLKTRLNITNATDDARLQRFCDFVNGWIETKTGRVLAPIAGAGPYLFDGHDALENGRLLIVPQGLRNLALVEVAMYTGAAFTVVPATDYFLRPTAQERDPGWPATELWMSDIPSAGNSTPYFPPGFANIRLTGNGTGLLGWPAQPDEIVAIAEKVVVLGWQSRGSGERNKIGGENYDAVVRSVLDGSDWHTIGRYTFKPIEII
jgi:hypothetical protein